VFVRVGVIPYRPSRQSRRQPQGVRASSNTPSGCPEGLGASVSIRGLTLTPQKPSSYARPLRTRTRRSFEDGFDTEVFRRQRGGSRILDRRLHPLVRGPFRQDSFLRERYPQAIPLLVSACPAANITESRVRHEVAPDEWQLASHHCPDQCPGRFLTRASVSVTRRAKADG
jgi:hypothetical protein